MASIALLKHSTGCPKCEEQLIAPERSESISTVEVHHFWCCWSCDHEFETLDHLQLEGAPPSELIKKCLPSLLAA